MAERRLTLTRVETGTLDIDGQEYAVRIGADLDVEILSEIMELQLEIRRYGNTNAKRIPDWIRRSKRLILAVIHEHHPDVADLKLSPTELVQVLAFLGGSDDVPGDVARALSEGAPATEGAEGSSDPTISQRRSRSRSSRSARRSTSAPSGGEDSDGASSSSTSAISTAA